MKKRLPLVICFLLLSLHFYAADIPFDQYGNVLLSNYEKYADNQTVKITLTISNAAPNENVASGWGVGTIKPINNPTATTAYEFNCKVISAEGAENVYEFTIAQLKEFAKVNGEYFVDEYGQKGFSINVYNGATLISITVGAAVEASAVINFENDEIGTAYPAIAWSPGDITVVVEANPSGTGKALHITGSNYNSYPKFSVTFPEGKTVADIEKIKFNFYFPNGTGGQNSYKDVHHFIGKPGTSFTANTFTGEAHNLITNDATNTWIPKEITISTTNAELLALNVFDFGLGINAGSSDYYLNNIQFILKGTSSIPAVKKQSNIISTAGGIIVNDYNQKVTVYGIDGRMLRQVISRGQIIPLERGIYIVKVAETKAEKVLVK